MPEGPSIVILKEELSPFNGKKLVDVSGNAKIDLERMKGKKIIDMRSWGKHFLICFDGFFITLQMCIVCPECVVKIKLKHTGHRMRRSFFCVNCQEPYKKTGLFSS